MNRQRPQLKNGVDLQLQSAFNDGNWTSVIRLAEKRARALNDQYYEIVKICAEAQLDDPTAKFAAVAAISKYVKDGTIIKDVDAIDLLEWASGDLTEDGEFAETLGPLRVRLVKAAPKDKIAATRCLESCLLHWDLVSAQQIAAIIDRSSQPGAQGRSFMFWNIVITHMLAISSQIPPEKTKLYSMLALKQVQRAAEVAEQLESSKGDDTVKAQSKSVQTEEEILLLYDIVEKHGTADDFEKLVKSPVFCPIVQFRQGRKVLVLRVISKHKRDKDWGAIYQTCKDCLSIEEENGQPSLQASDWNVWREFILAAAQMKSADPGIEKTVQDLLVKFIKSPNMKPIYRRNILLARVSAAFNLAANNEDDLSEGRASSLRLRELIGYIHDQSTSAACFDDVKSFVERLSPLAMKHLAFDHVPKLADETQGQVNAARVRTLGLKLQYFVSTCPSMYTNTPGQKSLRKFIGSDEELDGASCSSSFAKVAQAALEVHQSLSNMINDHPAVETEIRPDLALLIALCNIQQAYPPSTEKSQSPASLQPLFRAVLILEHQLSLTPKHGTISLVLVQLYLLLGGASRARDIWETLGVKRTIMDSLAPIFYDRLSTIAPAMISPESDSGWQLLELLNSHYSVSLKLRMPRRLIDAFEAGNFGSILSMPTYIESLRWSCTRAISLVEEVRTERALGFQFTEVLHDSRYYEVEDETRLNEVIDYGSFPSWDCSSCPPIFARLRIGPPPTNRRAHLSLLSEGFHEVLAYKPPPIYKAGAAVLAQEQIFVLETLNQLTNSFTKFLRGSSSGLTKEEIVYFQVVSLLCTLIPLATTSDRSAALSPVLSEIINAVKTSLETLRLGVAPANESGVIRHVSLLSSMHGVAMFRDTAAAAFEATKWILAFNEREKEHDRSGKSNLPKELVLQIKELQDATDAAFQEGSSWIKKLKEGVNSRDFEPQVRRWIFENNLELLDVVGNGAIASLVKHWEANVKGWMQVKWS